jgi:hypothetical protein
MDVRALIREAQSPQTAVPRLVELATHVEPDVRRAAARHPSLPPDVLLKLLDDASWEVRVVAAHHPKAPSDRATAMMEAMAAGDDINHRRIAARSSLLSPDTLARLTSDPDVEVRANASKNRRTPKDAARKGLTDSEPAVVLSALAHPSVTNQERRAFVSEDLIRRFFEAHADGDHLFEALCERYLWDVLERAFLDPERFDDVWQELVKDHFELVEIPSRNAMLAAVSRPHWPAVAAALARECRAGERTSS